MHDAVEDEEEHPAAVERGQGQQVHHRDVHCYERAEVGDVGDGHLGRLRALADVVYEAHNAHGARELVNAHRSRNEVGEREPDRPHEIEGVVPGILQRVPERRVLHSEGETVHGRRVAFILLRRECEIFKFYLLAVSYDDDVVRLTASGEDCRDVGGKVYPVAVYLVYLVPYLKGALALVGTAVHEIGYDRRIEALRARVDDEHDYKAEQEVHEAACDEDDEFLPAGLDGEAARVAGVLVLALHGAVTADGQAAEGVQRLALLLF